MSEFVNKEIVMEMVKKTINPSMGKKDYECVMDLFNIHNGFMSKCQDEKGNLEGYLIRLEDPSYSNIVYINFFDCNNNEYKFNKYFKKSIAILQTMNKGMRYIDRKKKYGEEIKCTSFNDVTINCKDLAVINKKGTYIKKLNEFFEIIYGDETFDDDIDFSISLKTNKIIEKYLFDYMVKFEEKARKYYGENAKNKIFIVLPF